MGTHKHKSRNKGSLTFAGKVTISVAVIVGCLFAVWLMAWGYMLVRVRTDQTANRIEEAVAIAGKMKGLAHMANDTAHETIQNVKSGLQIITKSDKHRENDSAQGSLAAASAETDHAPKAEPRKAELPPAPIPPAPPPPPPIKPSDDFVVDLDVHLSPDTKGVISILFKREWAPLGVDRIHQLVTSGFFDGVHFHRVLRGFIAQFGISGDPAVQHNWTNRTIKDDPVVESNRRGMVTFAMAGKHSRTTQLFINYANNLFLDKQGFSPVGKVVAGMDIVSGLYNEYQDEPNRQLQNMTAVGKMTTKKFLDTTFPELSYIISATLKPAPNR